MKAETIIRLATTHGLPQPPGWGATLMWDREDEQLLALALLRGESLYENDYSGMLGLSDTGGVAETELGLPPIQLPRDVQDALIAGAFGWKVDHLDSDWCRSIWFDTYTGIYE